MHTKRKKKNYEIIYEKTVQTVVRPYTGENEKNRTNYGQTVLVDRYDSHTTHVRILKQSHTTLVSTLKHSPYVSTIWDENLYTGPIKTLQRPQKPYILFLI